MFGQMFGDAGKGPKKTKSVIHPIKCTLEDLYNGKNSRIKVSRDRICTGCAGKGGDQGDNQRCKNCVGKGKILR
jgi:DnaJ family protein A protein 2